MRHAVSVKVVLACAFVAMSASLSGAASYYPLEKGSYWVYDRHFSADKAPVRCSVVDRTDTIATLDVGGTLHELRDRGEEVDLWVDPGEYALHYHFLPGTTWEHRDWYTCSDKTTVTVEPEPDPITTPAGTFRDCLRITYVSPACMDAGKTAEWWAPGVGLVRWYESSFGGQVAADLVEYRTSGGADVMFLRGDANARGERDIADAVYILSYLFARGSAPTCFDAADANDDGKIDISDAIRFLTWLFIWGGGFDLPPPSSACGTDPTDDGLDCAAYAPCDGHPCLEFIAAIAQEVTYPCTAVVRLRYVDRHVLGWQLFTTTSGDGGGPMEECDPSWPVLSPANVPALVVRYEAPGDFGGVCVSSWPKFPAVFGATIVWLGTGEILQPTEWRPAEALSNDCQVIASRPRALGYDLASGEATLPEADVTAALDVVWRTALPAGLMHGGYFDDAAVLLYPRSVGAFNPVTAEWIVIINCIYLE